MRRMKKKEKVTQERGKIQNGMKEDEKLGKWRSKREKTEKRRRKMREG